LNEKEISIISDRETTISREKSEHYKSEIDSIEGDIVKLTIRSQEEFLINDYNAYLDYPFDKL